jgi:hypothetical protein
MAGTEYAKTLVKGSHALHALALRMRTALVALVPHAGGGHAKSGTKLAGGCGQVSSGPAPTARRTKPGSLMAWRPRHRDVYREGI